MKKAFQIATFFIAACALSTGALGQKVYKCGTNYSQIPCDGAVQVDVQDDRTRAQKIQSEEVIAKDAATANAMEKARLKEAALAQTKAKKPPETKPAPDKAKPTEQAVNTKKPAGKKKHEPEFFTAKVAPEKKSKTADPGK